MHKQIAVGVDGYNYILNSQEYAVKTYVWFGKS